MVARKVSLCCLQPLLICIAENWVSGATLLMVRTKHGAFSKVHIKLYLESDTTLNYRKNSIPKTKVKSFTGTTEKFNLPRQVPRCSCTSRATLFSGLVSAIPILS